MNTKDLIRQKALQLFNTKGLMNVTLRDVAAELNKSYGNITYHYTTKERLIEELYIDMIGELKAISAQMMAAKDLFSGILNAPNLTFDLSIKYLFFFKDYVELKRNFTALARQIDASNQERKKVLLHSLIALQQQNILRKDLDKDDLNYLMELSGAMRTFFFINLSEIDLKNTQLKEKHTGYTNKLLVPYLTPEGKALYTNNG